MKDEPQILAIDIGSSSVRCRLYGRDLRGKSCGEGAVRRYPWRTTGGAMEVDAELLFEELLAALDAAVAAVAASGQQVVGVAVASFWHSLLGLDDAGAPATPLFGWGDTRAAQGAVELHSRLEPEAYHQRTGCFLHTSYPPAKLVWLREEDPASFASVASWVSFPEYVERRLFGSSRASLSIASGSGFFDLHTLRWDPAALEACGVGKEQLSPLVDLEPILGIKSQWVRRWPPLAGVPWFPALGDGACANLGMGSVGVARPGITIGTSAAARIIYRAQAEEEVPGDLWCYRLDSEYRVAGGALSNGGNGLAYLRRLLNGLDGDALDRKLRSESPDGHGLTVIPSLIQERGLGWTEIESAAILGLRPEISSVDVAAAWLEALAQRIAELVRRLGSRFGDAAELRSSGGALRAVPAWLQTLADATDLPVLLGSDPEETSRGAALVVARELGWIDSLEPHDQEVDGLEISRPRAGAAAVHRRALGRQRRIAQAIRRARDEEVVAEEINSLT